MKQEGLAVSGTIARYSTTDWMVAIRHLAKFEQKDYRTDDRVWPETINCFPLGDDSGQVSSSSVTEIASHCDGSNWTIKLARAVLDQAEYF